MKQLKPNSLTRTICLMSFFSAINVICSLLTVFAPLLSIILIIILPLTSALVEINCKDRWFPIYAFATIGLSMVVSLSSIDFTLFYVVPSILTGYIFGLTSKKNVPDMFGIFLATAAQTLVSFIFVPIIKLITERNIIDDFAKIFGISNRFFYDNAIILLFFVVSLIQVVLSFIVVSDELRKLGLKQKNENDYEIYSSCASLLSGALIPAFLFTHLQVAYLLVGMSWFFAVFTVTHEVKEKQIDCIIINAIIFLCSIFLYAGLNQFLIDGKDFILFAISPVFISCVSISHYFLKKSKE